MLRGVRRGGPLRIPNRIPKGNTLGDAPRGCLWGYPGGCPEILRGIPQGPSQAIPKVSLSGHPPGYPRVSHWEAQGIFIHQDKSQGSPEVILRKPGGPPRGSPLGDHPDDPPTGHVCDDSRHLRLSSSLASVSGVSAASTRYCANLAAGSWKRCSSS